MLGGLWGSKSAPKAGEVVEGDLPKENTEEIDDDFTMDITLEELLDPTSIIVCDGAEAETSDEPVMQFAKKARTSTGSATSKAERLAFLREQVMTSMARLNVNGAVGAPAIAGCIQQVNAILGETLNTGLSRFTKAELDSILATMSNSSNNLTARYQILAKISFKTQLAHIAELKAQVVHAEALLGQATEWAVVNAFAEDSGNTKWADLTTAVTDALITLDRLNRDAAM